MRPRGANRAPFPRGALTGTDLDRFYIDNLSQSGTLRAHVEVRSCRSRGSRPFAPVVPPRSTSRGVLELRKAKASTRPFPFAEPSAVGTFNSVRPRVRSLRSAGTVRVGPFSRAGPCGALGRPFVG
jgi:hypothetical protein